ncbi:TnsA endonuclease C-terminal domain-containing protein [Burkholderia sp. Bp9142]|uniref:TnsA endonuclease C-terminal domain-containing protein n=1 Tax=Burkholderia sp. Bp9142 TaxID=2184573 RepID=UPI000F5A5A5C|nr:TnsA endonuclease C-terminal domain-containing protein [Burkholderia sp. Bp9142]RQR27306.1 heteromeric transposase endonuclease subunit TnsA [Burkholderia sp. Bp9142]
MTSRTVGMRRTTRERKLKEQETAKREGRHERWIGTRDMPGVGMKTRLTSSKTGLRAIHLLSDGEKACFLELWWDLGILTIYDQVMLEPEKTLRAAARAGVDHPRYPDTGDPVVLSTDLVAIGERNGRLYKRAISVKSSERFGTTDKTPKQKIEEQYWLGEGARFEIFKVHGMHAARHKNLGWLLKAENDMLGRELSETEEIAQRELLRRLRKCMDARVVDACEAVERQFSLQSGAGAQAFRQLAAKRIVSFDLESKNPVFVIVKDLRVNVRL